MCVRPSEVTLVKFLIENNRCIVVAASSAADTMPEKIIKTAVILYMHVADRLHYDYSALLGCFNFIGWRVVE